MVDDCGWRRGVAWNHALEKTRGTKAAAEELERLGIADRDGKRIRTELPNDMQEGADCDFGG